MTNNTPATKFFGPRLYPIPVTLEEFPVPNLDILFPAWDTWENAKECTPELLESMFQFVIKADPVTRLMIYSQAINHNQGFYFKLHTYKNFPNLILESTGGISSSFSEEEMSRAQLMMHPDKTVVSDKVRDYARANIKALYQEYKLNKSALDTSCTLVRE